MLFESNWLNLQMSCQHRIRTTIVRGNAPAGRCDGGDLQERGRTTPRHPHREYRRFGIVAGGSAATRDARRGIGSTLHRAGARVMIGLRRCQQCLWYDAEEGDEHDGVGDFVGGVRKRAGTL